MQRVVVFLLFTLVVSCKYFNAKKIASEDILEEELKTINWNTIDVYPAFETCDTKASKADLKQCFEATLSNTISNVLQKKTIVVSKDLSDTIVLEFLISEIGEIQLQNVSANQNVHKAIPNLERILINSLDDLPSILPAVKRNQAVKTAFTLPINITAN